MNNGTQHSCDVYTSALASYGVHTTLITGINIWYAPVNEVVSEYKSKCGFCESCLLMHQYKAEIYSNHVRSITNLGALF